MNYRELQTFYNVANSYLSSHKEENKFNYALKRVMKSGKALLVDFSEKIENLDIEYCATNKDGIMLRDAQGRLEFDKAGLRKRNEERKKLLDSEADVKAHFVNDIPKELSDFERESFEGFVIHKSPELELVESK